ncbi:MAG: M48 family metalloprotease [Acidimicrobiales bacterium]
MSALLSGRTDFGNRPRYHQTPSRLTTMEREDGSVLEPGDVTTPSYHRELADHLEGSEPELWAWFAGSSTVADRQDPSAEVELLKSAYRLDGGAHDVLAGHATLLADRLGIDQPIVLYQELNSEGGNARVFPLNDRIHVVFSGDLLDLLTADEAFAVLAHELAHVELWHRDHGRYLVLDHLVHRLASEPTAADAVVETARRLRLHTEVWADAASAELTGNTATVVTSIVKVNAGIRHVEADAYLRQAAEILELDAAASQAWTHPELHIRVACLEARNRGTSAATIAALISGPDDLDRLDLLGQLRLRELTARVLRSGAAAAADLGDGETTDGVDTYIRSYPDLAVADAAPIGDGELADHEASVRWLAAAILVDIALSEDGSGGLDEIRALAGEADRLGVADEFERILGRANGRPAGRANGGGR